MYITAERKLEPIGDQLLVTHQPSAFISISLGGVGVAQAVAPCLPYPQVARSPLGLRLTLTTVLGLKPNRMEISRECSFWEILTYAPKREHSLHSRTHILNI